jgi:hypothetical protein
MPPPQFGFARAELARADIGATGAMGNASTLRGRNVAPVPREGHGRWAAYNPGCRGGGGRGARAHPGLLGRNFRLGEAAHRRKFCPAVVEI